MNFCCGSGSCGKNEYPYFSSVANINTQYSQNSQPVIKPPKVAGGREGFPQIYTSQPVTEPPQEL